MSKSDDPNISSVEAAALYLSNGETMDPGLAVNYNNGIALNIDKLEKAALRRAMGFNFDLQIMPNVILVTARDGSMLRTRCKVFEGDLVDTPDGPKIANEETITRLVAACNRLKRKWDERDVR